MAASTRHRWTPMAYGSSGWMKVDDPVFEPAWGGLRVLVEVSRGKVELLDIEGDPIPEYEQLRDAIADAVLADELVLDGHLVPAPLRDTLGARLQLAQDAAETAGQRIRHVFLGANPGQERHERIAAAAAARRRVTASGTAAFVAVDLLSIDGESLLDVPLLERKRILESALDERELVRRTMAVRSPVEAWFAQWKALGFSEIAIKGANSRYVPGTASREWATAPIPRR